MEEEQKRLETEKYHEFILKKIESIKFEIKTLEKDLHDWKEKAKSEGLDIGENSFSDFVNKVENELRPSIIRPIKYDFSRT